MSLDLEDLKRLKITAETRTWLTAESHITGRSAQEIARDVLHAKAMDRIHAAKVLIEIASGEAFIRDGRVNIGAEQGRRK
jgi:hypothetical protein